MTASGRPEAPDLVSLVADLIRVRRHLGVTQEKLAERPEILKLRAVVHDAAGDSKRDLAAAAYALIRCVLKDSILIEDSFVRELLSEELNLNGSLSYLEKRQDALSVKSGLRGKSYETFSKSSFELLAAVLNEQDESPCSNNAAARVQRQAQHIADGTAEQAMLLALWSLRSAYVEGDARRRATEIFETLLPRARLVFAGRDQFLDDLERLEYLLEVVLHFDYPAWTGQFELRTGRPDHETIDGELLTDILLRGRTHPNTLGLGWALAALADLLAESEASDRWYSVLWARAAVATAVEDFVDRDDLTDREAAVLRLMIAGNSSTRVGEILGLSVRTVELHMYRVRLKLDASTDAEAFAVARQSGIV